MGATSRAFSIGYDFSRGLDHLLLSWYLPGDQLVGLPPMGHSVCEGTWQGDSDESASYLL